MSVYWVRRCRRVGEKHLVGSETHWYRRFCEFHAVIPRGMIGIRVFGNLGGFPASCGETRGQMEGKIAKALISLNSAFSAKKYVQSHDFSRQPDHASIRFECRVSRKSSLVVAAAPTWLPIQVNQQGFSFPLHPFSPDNTTRLSYPLSLGVPHWWGSHRCLWRNHARVERDEWYLHNRRSGICLLSFTWQKVSRSISWWGTGLRV